MVREKIEAYLALGSNLGDRAANLDAAESAVACAAGVYLDHASPTYESPAAGPVEQPPFLNRALAIQTWLGPRELLATCLAVEKKLGRQRKKAHGPRLIDIDILLFGELVIDEEGLTIPHEALIRRAFFLRPLADVAGDIILPGEGVPLPHLLADLAPYELARYERKY